MIKKFHYVEVNKFDNEDTDLILGVTFENQSKDLISPSVIVTLHNNQITGIELYDEGLDCDYNLTEEEKQQVLEYIRENDIV